MDPAASVHAVAGVGLDGSAERGGRRQVTLLSREAWSEACRELGIDISPSYRRANLLVTGIELAECAGRVLRVGQVSIEIHGETRPCGMMEQVSPGLYRALLFHWRGGVFGEITTSGRISVGDRVSWRGDRQPLS